MHEMQTIVTDVCCVSLSVCHAAEFGGACSVCGVILCSLCQITLASCYLSKHTKQKRHARTRLVSFYEILTTETEWIHSTPATLEPKLHY